MRKQGEPCAERITIIIAVFVFPATCAFLSQSTAGAVTCTATTDGNWSNSSLWDCGHVPTTTDDVLINNGATVLAGGTLCSFFSLTIDGTA